jgi:hypothetical protein
MKALMILSLMTVSLSAYAGIGDAVYDRALTQAEMQKLLPQYLAMVEKQAAQLPSASENEAMWGLAGFLNDHTFYAFDENNKVIGRQSHTAETLVKNIESTLKELKEVTPAQREEEAADLLAGFEGAADAGKISCHLGYEDKFKDDTSRIVKCEDDRSYEGNGGDDEEGYYDVRRIILSIDGKTLAPVNTLKLEHPIAG